MAANEQRVFYAQNFLKSTRLVDRLLDLTTIGPDDTVYEIGPGRGIITERLARRCRRVVAIEKDPMLAASLQRRHTGCPWVTIVQGDALQVPLPRQPYKVFANIPFNVTADIVTRLVTAAIAPDDTYLVVQREAAYKIMGWPRESLYAVLLKPWFEPSIVYRFKRHDFTPVPNVETVLLRLRKRGPPLVSRRDACLFRDFAVYGFTAARPSVRCAFKGILSPRQVAQAGIGPAATPAEVPFEQWLALFDVLKQQGDGRVLARLAGSEARLRRRQARLPKIHRTRINRP